MRRRGPQLFKAGGKNQHARKKVVKPAEVEPLFIESLTEQGEGLARHQGRPVVVPRALPGEQVLARITASFRRHDQASLESIVETSPERIPPLCEYYDQCGGCQLQHWPQAQQQAFKQQQLAKLLAGFGYTGDIGLISSAPVGYRHRARLAFQEGVLGFRLGNSHQLAGIDHCPLLTAGLNRQLGLLREALREAVPANTELECLLSDSVSRSNAAGASRIGLHLQLQPRRGRSKGLPSQLGWLEELASALPAEVALFSVAAADGGPIYDGQHHDLDYALDEILALRFGPADFTQVNPAVNREMIALVCQWLAPQPDEPVDDYFCGLGNFSLPLSSSGAKLRGFDAGAAMIARARQQAQDQGREIRYHCVDLFDAEQLPSSRGVKKALLDPPRAGAKLLSQQLATSRDLEKLVYVSCSAASLARDLQYFHAGGFKIAAAMTAEMFPQTYHQESLVLLER